MSEGPKAIPGFADAGIAGTFLELPPTAALVAPTSTSHFNVLRRALIPLACWRMDELWFDFDSSFVRPEASTEFPALYALRAAHPGAPLSVFGHADPVADDAYNKRLSGRRAEAVYALLIRDPARWETLYSQSAGGDVWGLRSVQVMLKTLGHDPGLADGVLGTRTKAATQSFQRASGLAEDGDPGPQTRAKLFLAYMDTVCVNDQGQPFQVQKTDFLAKGADAGGKGDVQGCSEFNPLLVFSQEERQELSPPGRKDERDAQNAPNRRVVVFLFRPNSSVTPERWPCPRVSEGIAGCQKRFWSDGEKRRNPQAARRKFEDTQDTFACRFYHRLALNSPCERYALRDYIRVEDELGEPVANTPVECLMSDGSTEKATTDAQGMILVFGKRLVRVEMEDIHKMSNA